MKNFIYNIQTKIEVGFSESRNISKYVAEIGSKKVLLIADHFLIQKGLIDFIIYELKKKSYSLTIFDEIKNEPTISEIDSVIDRFSKNNFDIVIGIGGGSTIDTAKILSVSKGIKGTIKKYFGTNTINGSGLPTIMIPTTAGTGSEVTPNTIVKDEKESCKKAIVSPYLIPNIAILDAELTLSLPPKNTAETGIDAFTHAIECFVCKKSNPISDLFALGSMNLISSNLLKAVKSGNDKKARYNMLLGSLYAGVALVNSGGGAVHALAYPLGGKYNISHGLSNAALLADVMEFNAEAVPAERFLKVAQAMNIETYKLPDDEIINKVLQTIRELVKDVGIKINLSGITESEINELAKSALSIKRLMDNNPRSLQYHDVVCIYKSTVKLRK